MEKSIGVFRCGCCDEIFPDIHLHTHHKVPQALGGTDEPSNLIDLCPGCHDTLHNVAYKLMNRNYSVVSVLDSVKLVYKENARAIKICTELAIKVRDSMVLSREKGKSPDQLVQLSLTLRKRHKDLLALRAQELHLSQEDYIRVIVLKDLVSRYKMQQISVAGEAALIKAIKKGRVPSGS
jgi:hypothetical protein